ncbi:ribonuclease P protein component [Candidatus Kuenenbacteria bacterium]|nr:ribonuclease P protein component [Candidatus Kuenenbacteria bacterium]
MLAKNNRLRLKKEYDQVFKKGQRYSSPFFNLVIHHLVDSKNRFGIIISTNISKKATVRNLLKRRIRAIIKKHLSEFKDGFDIVIIAKISSVLLSYSELEQELVSLFYKSHILKNKE